MPEETQKLWKVLDRLSEKLDKIKDITTQTNIDLSRAVTEIENINKQRTACEVRFDKQESKIEKLEEQVGKSQGATSMLGYLLSLIIAVSAVLISIFKK